jgi:N-acetylglutamate synthase-like GNAT family acetyltransferase
VRVIELRDDRHGLEAFMVVDHDQFPIAAGGTRMLADVDVGEVARLRVTPLAAALRAGRDFLAESGARDDLLDELFA